MVDAIYSYLAHLNETQKRALTKYNTHKNIELKDIYNSIIRINKSSPLYLINPAMDNQLYALKLKEAAIQLQATGKLLTDNTKESVFFTKKAVSSNPDIVSAEIITENYEDLPDNLCIQVDSIACNQQNKTNDIYNNGIGPREGTYIFSIIQDDKQHDFHLHLSERGKNKDILNQLMNLINNASLGIKAAIIPGNKENTSHFILNSEATGILPENQEVFNLSDIQSPSSQPGIVEYYSLNQTISHACNAVFTVNGEARTSLSNDITINNALHITLKNASPDKTAIIKYTPDTTQVLNSVTDIIDSYNCLLNLAMSHAKAQNSARKLVHNLQYIVTKYSNELNTAGIYYDDNYLLSLNDNSAYDSVIKGTTKEVFTMSNGLISELNHIASEIKLNPLEYLDKKIVIYPNTAKLSFPNPYLTSMYSGMLFNYFC